MGGGELVTGGGELVTGGGELVTGGGELVTGGGDEGVGGNETGAMCPAASAAASPVAHGSTGAECSRSSVISAGVRGTGISGGPPLPRAASERPGVGVGTAAASARVSVIGGGESGTV